MTTFAFVIVENTQWQGEMISWVKRPEAVVV